MDRRPVDTRDPHQLDVRRIAFPRPRSEVIELVGEGHQGLPKLVMDASTAPGHALRVGHYAILKDVREIGWAIQRRHGGVGPHP